MQAEAAVRTAEELADLLFNEAIIKIDLLTQQRDSARTKVAELYLERDAAWAALLEIEAEFGD